MIALVRYWMGLCLLRAAPQDGSASAFILVFSLTCYSMVSVLVLTASYGMGDGVRLAFLEVLLLSAYVVLLLSLTGKSARVRQTLSALTGAGTLLGIVSFLLVLTQGAVPAGDAPSPLASIAWLSLVFWNLVVSAHIIRHALSTNLLVGFVMSLLYMVISTRLALYVIPLQEEVGLTG